MKNQIYRDKQLPKVREVFLLSDRIILYLPAIHVEALITTCFELFSSEIFCPKGGSKH
jgi:hypothetical protein